MRNLLHLSTRMQLAAAFGLFVVLVGVVVTVGIFGFQRLTQMNQELHTAAFEDVMLISQIESDLERARVETLTLILSENGREERLHSFQAAAAESRRHMEQIRNRFGNNPQIGPVVEELSFIYENFVDTRDNQVVPAVMRGDLEEASETAARGLQRERFERIRELTGELYQHARTNAQELASSAESAAARTIWVFAGIAIIAVILALFLSFFLTSLIAQPMVALARVAERIAGGDLSVVINQTNRQDEVGVLTNSFRRMLEGLRDFNREVYEGVNVLASTASEILAATTQIATGVSETAASVNQTTSTLEESRQTAKLVSQKAGAVLEISQRVSHSSMDGRKKVDEAVGEMHVIKEHMENIGRSIMRLHEHSQAIGDIIASVNELAEQSNILAINAAIEAAKAGEQGKGFAVVAHEIKSLSVQSKQATAQVRTILGDIQQTANSTVMATERGNKVVEAGVERSRAAGEAIRAMADSVAAASQAAMQISASSNEQLVGMDQVASAMENITQASHQNAAGTKQAELSARNLHDLGQRLKELTGRYRLN